MTNLGLEGLKGHLQNATRVRQIGRVLQVVGTIIEAELPGVAVGAIADIGDTQVEVVGFRENRALLQDTRPAGAAALGRAQPRGSGLLAWQVRRGRRRAAGP